MTRWRRSVVLIAFLALITAASLLLTGETRTIAAARGEAGGRLGAEIATILQDSITLYGAWALEVDLGVGAATRVEQLVRVDRSLVELVARLDLVAVLDEQAWSRSRPPTRKAPMLVAPMTSTGIPLSSNARNTPMWI